MKIIAKYLITLFSAFANTSLHAAVRVPDPCDIYDCTESPPANDGILFYGFSCLMIIGILYGLIFNATFRRNFLYFFGGCALMVFIGGTVMRNFGETWGMIAGALIAYLWYKGIDKFIE